MPPANLSTGDSGDEVVWLHEALARSGFEVSADERSKKVFGPSTKKAVEQFQEAHGLEPTGQVGEDTRAGLGGDEPHGATFVRGQVLYRHGARIEDARRDAFDREPARDVELDRGTIEPAADVLVEAFLRGLRTHEPIGGARTDAEGRYEIPYSPDALGLGEGATAEILVRATREGTGGATAEVRARLQVGDDVVVDLDLAPPVSSEWSRIGALLAPLLAGQGEGGQPLDPWELDDDDVATLADDTGLDHDAVRAWALAAREVHAEWPDVPFDSAPESIAAFGWFRGGLPAPLIELLRKSADELLQSLEGAAKEGWIPPLDRRFRTQLKRMLEARRSDAATRPADSGEPARAADALRLIPDADKLELDQPDGLGRRLLVRLLAPLPEDVPRLDVIRELVGDEKLANSVERSLQLRTLTDGHTPLMEALLPQSEDPSLADLVEMEEKDWIELARTTGMPVEEGESEKEGHRKSGKRLARAIERMHPTRFLQHQIASNRIQVPEQVIKPLDEFLSANPEIRFGQEPLITVLSRADLDPGGLDGDQIRAVGEQLLRLERVARLTPRLAYVGDLVANGYESARDIVLRRTRETFVAEIAKVVPDGDEAREIYDAAAGVVAATEGLVLSQSVRFSGAQLPVLSTPDQMSGAVYGQYAATAAGIPIQPANLQQLFGSQDRCECAHGASLYGPAAYLADLLQMLARGPVRNGQTALDVLLARRPDLAEVDLTGDNADITLPYIDMVLEILEVPDFEASLGFRVIRGGTRQNPVDFQFDAALDQGSVPQALADDLASWTLSLGEHRTAVRGADAQNRVGVTFSSWLVRDGESGMKVRLLGVVPAGYRLRAYPQSVEGAKRAYRPWSRLLSSTATRVASARFPWALPFDVTRDEANTWLAHLGASREQAMLAFAGAGRWTDLDAACEALDFARERREILTTAPSTSAPEYGDWGFPNATVGSEGVVDPIAGATGTFVAAGGRVEWTGPDGTRSDPPQWHALLKNVSLLRSRARLGHRELLGVLETRFVRAGGPRLEITGAECNPGLMRLEAMDAALARRLHLFVRLWRDLGWSTIDLDRAIGTRAAHTSGTGSNVALTPAFLLFVANIARLHRRTGVAVADLLDLFGAATLDATRSWDHSGSQPVRTLSRYEQWFDNPTLGRPRLPELHLDAAGTGLQTVPSPSAGLSRVRITDHRTYVAAALGLAEREFMALMPTAVVSIVPAQVSATGRVGTPVDVGDAPLKEVELVVGALSQGATFDVLVEHSPDGQTFTTVPAAQIGGTNPIAINATSSRLRRFTYSGSSRFLRISVSSTGGTNPTVWLTTRVLTAPGVVTDELSLANLTTLSKWGVLRRVADRSVDDVRTLIALTGRDPLAAGATPDLALALLDDRDALVTAGLSISAADELLRGRNGTAAETLEQKAETLLTTARSASRVIQDESTVAPAQSSVLLTSVLTSLGWDEQLVARVLSADALAIAWEDYAAPLSALPTGVTLPATLTFVEDAERLTASRSVRPKALRKDLSTLLGQVTGDLQDALAAIDAEASSREAVLADAQALMRAVRLPTHRVSVGAATVSAFDVPPEWQGRFFYDREAGDLCFTGWMTEADATAIKLLFPTPPVANFGALVDALRAASAAYVPAAGNALVVREPATGGVTVEALLLDTEGLQDRSALLLARILPGWRRDRLRSKLEAALAQALGCEPDAAGALLDLPGAPTGAGATPDFGSLVTSATLLTSDPATRASRTAFPAPFEAAARLLVLGQLARAVDLDASDVPWLRGAWDGLDLTVVPTRRVATPPAGAWSSLVALSRVLSLRKKLEAGAAGVREALAAAAGATVDQDRLAAAMDYDAGSLQVLEGADGLGVTGPAWLRAPAQLLQLVECVALGRKLSVPADLLARLRRVQMAGRPVTEAESETQALRQVSLGSGATDAEGDVLDEIRLRRRDATVAYLVQARGLRDADDLYGSTLIDAEMGPCMLTSRIVQAISSVQLFVQRCFMGLEPDAPPDAVNRDHWEWMKNYRVWEANRKVLLYPENWIEPELRDDKTPFFDELVSDMQQGDANSDKAQVAMGRFLERLTDFSRMEIVAICPAYDDQNRLLTTHIFARTLSEPRAYYHRQFQKLDPEKIGESLGIWSSWKPITLDIEGDHLVPVVWQGRLFLFWAIFSTEADEPPPSQLKQGQDGSNPTKFWRLKIAWSELKSGAWTSRRLAQNDLSNTRIFVGAPTSNRRDAAAVQAYFYFYASVQEDGVTLNGQFLNWYYNQYWPFATLFFDGQRVVRANGTYVSPPGTIFFRFDQTPAQLAEAPVDGRLPPDDILTHGTTGVPTSAGQALSLRPKAPNPVTYFSKIPRFANVLFSPETVGVPFSAPSASTSTTPIPAGVRTTPYVVSDRVHQFFAYPTLQANGTETPGLHFYGLDWLPAQRLRKTLTRYGIDGLLSVKSQDPVANPPPPYFADYGPVASVITASPYGGLEFSPHSASSTYNYELFFHAPFSIACSLLKNQRFEETRRWFHYVFDPTDSSSDPSPARYWRFWPFRQSQGLPLDELLRRLADRSDHSTEKLEFQTAIAAWKDEPFKPHLVARMRPRSYMYAVVMKYLDNLLDWADQLFRRDTMESINEATQLYVLAAQILGRRPEGIPRRTRPVVKAFTELAAFDPDDLSNALVEAESLVPATGTGSSATPPHLTSLYFCLPGNPKLDDYHARVEDRLFKLRNCMNIDGVERELALFSPPIDPGLLVRAAAAGVNLAAVLADAQAPLPLYRFTVMAQKASELCGEVKSLGGALLGAIEKGDAEALALMRSAHERDLLRGIRQVKETQLLEARAGLDAIGVNLQSAQTRFTHYVGLVSELAALSIPTGPVVGPTLEQLGAAALEIATDATGLIQSTAALVDPITGASLEVTRQLMSRAAQALSASLPPQGMQTGLVPMNAAEQSQLGELKSAHDLQEKAADQRVVAQALAFIPDFTLGAQGFASSPVVQLQIGGTLLSKVASLAASITDSKASEHTYRGNLHSMLAGYQRRASDWLLQAQIASWEIGQLGEQLKSQTLRVAIASQELSNHDLQAAQAVEQQEFMSSKFTNEELLTWMSGQLATLHFQAYQLAYDTARRAERCFNNELGVESSFIEFGYWDSLRRGLLAGESLMSDIKRMEVAYLSQNARELEITKHVSLRELDPLALIRLRETGECRFNIPEVLFDLDFPGHYFRRIKAMRVSIPCVVGTYTGVSATLTLLSSKVRVRSTAFQGTYDHEENFRTSSFPAHGIATSNGQEDSGMFELNFHDERYLPFEGAGAISAWRIELPGTLRPFDYSTISDVILHVSYTARSAGGPLKQLAEDGLADAVNGFIAAEGQQGFAQLISLREDFPTEWARLTSEAETTGPASTPIALDKSRFPFLVSERSITLGSVDLYAVPADAELPADIDGLEVALPGSQQGVTMTAGGAVGRLQAKSFDANLEVEDQPEDAEWTFSVSAAGASDFRETVDDVVLLCHYSVGDASA